MIENLKAFMLRKYGYELNEFKLCTPEGKKQKVSLMPVYIYIVVLIGYAVQALEFIDFVYGYVAVIIMGVLLGMWQFMLIRKNKPQSLIVTPEFLIQTYGKKIFEVVNYDEIRKFKVSEKEGIIISDKKSEIIIPLVCYKNDLEPIVEILEAKGKTFDKSRDFMKRPIEIKIINGEIVIIELEEEESSTEKIVGEYYSEFKSLTPGFVKDIIFMNSVVEDAFDNDNNLILMLNKIEVKEGHPENTGFDSIIANDCIAIFENVKLKSVVMRNSRDRNAADEKLPLELSSITDNVEKGVIVDWKYRKKGMDLHFAAGMNIVKASLDYKEVIIGWKTFK